MRKQPTRIICRRGLLLGEKERSREMPKTVYDLVKMGGRPLREDILYRARLKKKTATGGNSTRIKGLLMRYLKK